MGCPSSATSGSMRPRLPGRPSSSPGRRRPSSMATLMSSLTSRTALRRSAMPILGRSTWPRCSSRWAPPTRPAKGFPRSSRATGWDSPSDRSRSAEHPVLTIRRDRDIHREEGGWFTARWHFSFDHYHDPHWMGVGPLRVFNHDRLVPGAVWPMHPHADIEGITYVWRGTFRHADSLGNNGVLHPGAVQL